MSSYKEADAATAGLGREFAQQSLRLSTGQALVSLFEARAVVLAHMAPSPFELMRMDNTSVWEPEQEEATNGLK
jgi:hypothetical protein